MKDSKEIIIVLNKESKQFSIKIITTNEWKIRGFIKNICNNPGERRWIHGYKSRGFVSRNLKLWKKTLNVGETKKINNNETY